jgi:hypothetical protein
VILLTVNNLLLFKFRDIVEFPSYKCGVARRSPVISTVHQKFSSQEGRSLDRSSCFSLIYTPDQTPRRKLREWQQTKQEISLGGPSCREYVVHTIEPGIVIGAQEESYTAGRRCWLLLGSMPIQKLSEFNFAKDQVDPEISS